MRADNIREITTKWLEENNVEYDEIFLNAEDKLKLVKENNIDIFIDDSFTNCKKIAHNSNAKVYIMNSKVNESLDDEKIERVFSWPEIYHLIGKEEL